MNQTGPNSSAAPASFQGGCGACGRVVWTFGASACGRAARMTGEAYKRGYKSRSYKSGAQGVCACSGSRAANHCALHNLFMCHLAEAAQVCGLLPLSALFLCHFAEAAQVWSACPFGFVPLPFCGGRPGLRACFPFRVCCSLRHAG